jgi:hypothetical protein
MTKEPVFGGFSKETIALFQGLRKNNNREWFGQHREVYENSALEPPKIMLGSGFYFFPDRLLDRFRRAVVDPKLGREISAIVKNN